MTTLAQLKPVVISLGAEAHHWAKTFAVEQVTPECQRRVYIDTLAVYAVHSFLRWMEVETDLEASESWNRLLGDLEEGADLVLPPLGTLECCTLLPGETSCTVPRVSIRERIGYVLVQFEQNLGQVQILGFVPPLDPDDPPARLDYSDLQPIETLFEYLERLEDTVATLPELMAAALQGMPVSEQDVVAQRVEQILADRSLPELIAQLERVYRTCSEFEWSFAAAEILAASDTASSDGLQGMGADREGVGTEGGMELQELAERLMEQLAAFWGDTAA
jgi:hypothetical protein